MGVVSALTFSLIAVSVSDTASYKGLGGPTASEVAFLLGIMVIGETFGYSYDFFYWSSGIIVHLGIFALIGALIGYFYGKFRLRKNVI